jgi:hypothetical protein
MLYAVAARGDRLLPVLLAAQLLIPLEPEAQDPGMREHTDAHRAPIVAHHKRQSAARADERHQDQPVESGSDEQRFVKVPHDDRKYHTSGSCS